MFHQSIALEISKWLDVVDRTYLAASCPSYYEVINRNGQEWLKLFNILRILFDNLECHDNSFKIVFHCAYLEENGSDVLSVTFYNNHHQYGTDIVIHHGRFALKHIKWSKQKDRVRFVRVLKKELECFYKLGIDEVIIWSIGCNERSRFFKQLADRLQSVLSHAHILRFKMF